jgi:hypothetical protein
MSDNKQLLAHFDWAASPLGPRSLWPVGMNAVITAVMDSDFPICTVWGDGFIQIYNAGYNSIYAWSTTTTPSSSRWPASSAMKAPG